jgi:hypothetical protein
MSELWQLSAVELATTNDARASAPAIAGASSPPYGRWPVVVELARANPR